MFLSLVLLWWFSEVCWLAFRAVSLELSSHSSESLGVMFHMPNCSKLKPSPNSAKHSRAKIFLNFALECLWQARACLCYSILAKCLLSGLEKTLALGGGGSLHVRAKSCSWTLEEHGQMVKTYISVPSIWESACWWNFSNWICFISVRSWISKTHINMCCCSIDLTVGCETPKTVKLLIFSPSSRTYTF